MDCWLYRDSHWQAIEPDSLAGELARPGSFAWLELQSDEFRDLERLGRAMDFHELALEDAISAHQRPKIEEYPNDHLFLAIRTALEWQEQVEYGETDVFLGRQYLIAVRHGHGPGYGRALARLKGGRFAPSAGSALYCLLDLIVDAYRPVADRLRSRYDQYESTLLETEQAEGNLPHIYALKRQTLLLSQTLEPMADMVHELIRMHPDVVDKGLKAYFRDVQDHLTRLNREMFQMREMLSDAMHVTLATLSLRQNESVQKLAGWGAILAVPTLVFSLYGMNFHVMPELALPWGYPAVLLLTGAVCYGLYRHLKRRGWI
ncbi:magnesium and cobalt transport protein CorA [Parasulfuritortus cantonensis]|uniref:Magnesium and cobalt transport protein CorA n=1 Tax=Parasulfuritortus cantonensis TaxID=2528202 RepID=A0A4R1BIK1_9PROT|nr:magnesium and cobalt transport protein CorA [Parasulfuritortus cantonensis]TCJ17091.1 magnesium and cobalt transport protein CorA [Parasulfuritortus cantonensis]